MGRLERFLFGVLLRLHPRDVRTDYEVELQEVLAERFERCGHSLTGVLQIWLNEAVSIVKHRTKHYRYRSRSGSPRWKVTMHSVIQDLRGGLRGVLRNRGLSAVVVLTLAVAIGAGTSIFSVVNGVLFKPLPVPDQDRLLAIWGRFVPESGFDFEYFPLSPPEYFDYEEASETLSEVVAFTTVASTLTGLGEEPLRVRGVATTSNMFSAFAVPPVLGRVLTPEDDVANSQVAVISDRMWTTFFGNDPGVVGRSLVLDGEVHEIVGVMPQDFGFPDRETSLWAPFGISRESGGRASHFVRSFALMKAGVSIDDVRAELGVLMNNWKGEYPDIHTGHFLVVEPLINNYVRGVKASMYVLLAAVGLLLMIACVNIAGVLLARGETRSQEFAVRHALGAGKARLFRQLFVEYSVLALLGGGLGVGAAYLGVPVLLGMEGNGIPRVEEVGVDLGVLGFSLVITMAALALFGIIPALQASRTNTAELIKEGARQSATGARLLFRRALISGEIALAVVISAAAGLMLNSVGKLNSVDTGIDATSSLTASISLPSSSYGEAEQALSFYTALLERINSDPRVVSATAANKIPYVGTPGVWDFEIAGMVENNVNGIRMNGHIDFVHANFFETTGVRLLQGRLFEEGDVGGSEVVTVISETMATTFWPGENPIGRQVAMDGSEGMGTIVGIVSDVHWNGMREDPRPTRYFLQSQAAAVAPGMTRNLQLAIKTSIEPMTFVSTLKAMVGEIDVDLPVRGIRTIDEAVARWTAQDRFFSLLMTLFASIAVGLATVGIYGVMSYTVAQRGKEIGIRMALGAPSTRVARSMVGQSLFLTAAGVGVGVLAALAGGGVLESLLFDVSARDPMTLLSVAGLFVVVGVVSALMPAVRAARINPVEALRAE